MELRLELQAKFKVFTRCNQVDKVIENDESSFFVRYASSLVEDSSEHRRYHSLDYPERFLVSNHTERVGGISTLLHLHQSYQLFLIAFYEFVYDRWHHVLFFADLVFDGIVEVGKSEVEYIVFRPHIVGYEDVESLQLVFLFQKSAPFFREDIDDSHVLE